MSEILMHHLIAFPTNAPSSTELWLACPQRRHELARKEADYLTQVLTESMDSLAAILVEEAGGSVAAKVMKEQLARPFVYAFGKGIEIIYKLRVGAEEPVEFNEEEMEDGVGDGIPEYLQRKVTSVIPVVMMIFGETIDFAEQEATSVLDIEELFKSILAGGMLLGVEFCLRQDLHDYR